MKLERSCCYYTGSCTCVEQGFEICEGSDREEMFETLFTQRIVFYVRTRNEPLYVWRNKTSKRISIFLSGSDNSSLRESILYTHTHTHTNTSIFFIIIILPLTPSRSISL